MTQFICKHCGHEYKAYCFDCNLWVIKHDEELIEKTAYSRFGDVSPETLAAMITPLVECKECPPWELE